MTGSLDPPVRAADPMADAGARLRWRMVQRIADAGGLENAVWRKAFEDVPRHLFVPRYYHPVRGGGFETLRHDDPDPRRRLRWLSGAYEDVPLVTHLRAGSAVSSSSQPSLMASMLEALEVRDADSVLEIGAGTGYNAALIAHRLGDDGRVTTMDLEEAITDSARDHLTAAGYGPRTVAVVTGDGALGCPDRAPYDRIMATCAMPFIPPSWPAQCRAGALILAPMANSLIKLRVSPTGRAEGRFLDTPAYFVQLRRAQPPQSPGEGEGEDIRERETRTGPRALDSESFRFVLGLAAGELGVRWSYDETRRLSGVDLSAPDGSTASADRGGTVLLEGRRDLWALVEEAYDLWERRRRPERSRFGLTVEGGRQWIWLDDPGGDSWPLTGASRPSDGAAT
ncbi:methyltransferase domain-containing protein [Wenjunlia tyrosinilytica]|uniref:Protein-L-isoaspartate O-methyltransferase n=1 Tax=Wenjunlia tyrosinilytica TaxID=1544741 RepID=A0A917ZEH8_9ACTN|nr:methyltransferase domain-containing protein [Wenjunlia tyrosinilytica]GGO81037.1 O-methyltransferase [Wenjunlia tyrosinilytica]